MSQPEPLTEAELERLTQEEFLADWNAMVERDARELRCQEYHNSLESGIEQDT